MTIVFEDVRFGPHPEKDMQGQVCCYFHTSLGKEHQTYSFSFILFSKTFKEFQPQECKHIYTRHV